jgi:hypothetical protein
LSWMMDEFIHCPKPYLLLSATCDEIVSWTMDEFIHWSKPYLLLSATCDEILSWILDVWMKDHLVSDSNCNTVNL